MDGKEEVVLCRVMPDGTFVALEDSVPSGEALRQTAAPADIDRRVRCVWLDSNAVLDWFASALTRWAGVISLPVNMGLPAGCRVLSVVENPRCRRFEFLVAHPSFDPVPPGEYPPDHAAHVEYRAFRIWQGG